MQPRPLRRAHSGVSRSPRGYVKASAHAFRHFTRTPRLRGPRGREEDYRNRLTGAGGNGRRLVSLLTRMPFMACSLRRGLLDQNLCSVILINLRAANAPLTVACRSPASDGNAVRRAHFTSTLNNRVNLQGKTALLAACAQTPTRWTAAAGDSPGSQRQSPWMSAGSCCLTTGSPESPLTSWCSTVTWSTWTYGTTRSPRIEPGTLSTSSRLVFLDLGSNNLTEIPKGMFGESRSLIKLRLGNNPHLSMVNEDAFLGLTSLRELELERNALSGLQVGALSQLPSLRVVRLEGNPWVCNCKFANLFTWLLANKHKLPNGVEGMECSLPTDGRRVALSQLSQDSFRECQVTLTLTDFLIIIFSGISVSVAAIMASFFLASTVHCFQRWSKGVKGDEEENEE
ncbi:hypothetical protein SKAU_G00159210 [Synaphobranchus kaupii]|uniref:LRRCT domain-containing protein n=1 Tax=Synaphobranchus kaupii TaxID=118154 RepID=A0A9Q1FIA3_SYNKA|nr:hypothetical protein SKAU_G00159210 [Synaphobranchus kaupii]